MTETFNKIDSAFIITIRQKGFRVTLLNKDSTLTDIEALDKFIEVNKPKDDYHHKIIISVPRKLIDTKLNPVVEVLKRNNYSKYLLSTTEQ